MSKAPRPGRILELSLDGGGYIVDEYDLRRCYPFHLGLIEAAPGAQDGSPSEETPLEGRPVTFRLNPSGNVEHVWMQTEPAREAVGVRRF